MFVFVVSDILFRIRFLKLLGKVIYYVVLCNGEIVYVFVGEFVLEIGIVFVVLFVCFLRRKEKLLFFV